MNPPETPDWVTEVRPVDREWLDKFELAVRAEDYDGMVEARMAILQRLVSLQRSAGPNWGGRCG